MPLIENPQNRIDFAFGVQIPPPAFKSLISLLNFDKMSADELWLSKEACEAYVEEQEKVTLVTPREREMEQAVLSHYLPDKDKVHVGLGIGGGLDFDVLKDVPRIVKRIGVDYYPNMLRLCRESHPNAELVIDDIRNLIRLRKILQREKRPAIFTLLTNTLGNFEPKERRIAVESVRRVMKGDDLLVMELYKRPELLGGDPGLIPYAFLKLKVSAIDLEKNTISQPVPLFKVFPFNLYMNDQYSWVFHSILQERHYGEAKTVQKIVGKIGHAAYWPETGDIVLYRPRKCKSPSTAREKSRREEFEEYFEPVLTSHRWEGMEIASLFLDAGLCGNTINGENTLIPFFSPYCKSEESLNEFEERYGKLFYKS
jgi:hypothetical protein